MTDLGLSLGCVLQVTVTKAGRGYEARIDSLEGGRYATIDQMRLLTIHEV
jgi:hypothetical protein